MSVGPLHRLQGPWEPASRDACADGLTLPIPREEVSAKRAGEVTNLGALFEAHFDYVWNTLRRLGVREADLEDLVHDVFLKVHQHRADYDPSRPFKPWAFSFAYRVAADYRRLARHRVEVFEGQKEAADPGATPERQLQAAQDWQLVHAALDSVSLQRRAVFVMHDIDGESAPQIAGALGIPLNTVYSRLRVARQDFAVALERLRSRGRP
jgi:RNA polymerase sigma-70 factor (ECF subfamily)